jgi:short-subunit dehydrogenase
VHSAWRGKRTLDRFGNCMAAEFDAKGIAITGMHPGLLATEMVAVRVKNTGLDDSVAVPMTVPARMIFYFSAHENPREYTGWLFWAERKIEQMGIEFD